MTSRNKPKAVQSTAQPTQRALTELSNNLTVTPEPDSTDPHNDRNGSFSHRSMRSRTLIASKAFARLRGQPGAAPA